MKFQEMLENTNEVKEELIMFHVKLLRKMKKSVDIPKWERAILKFANTYSFADGWEIERFGYKNCKLNLKLRLLKNLLEAQFDGNIKFKTEVNTKPADELRSEPLGRDKLGNLYWYQVDNEATMRIYKVSYLLTYDKSDHCFHSQNGIWVKFQHFCPFLKFLPSLFRFL